MNLNLNKTLQCSHTYIHVQRWVSYFLKVTHYLLLLPAAKNISLHLHIKVICISKRVCLCVDIKLLQSYKTLSIFLDN